MARSQFTDFLQVGRGHVIDVSFTVPPILLPVFGFRGCSLPELTLNIRNIPEGNYEYPRKVISGAEVGDVTLEQGVSIFNSDFYDWTRKALVGRKPAKNLLIVQFTRAGDGENAFALGSDISLAPGGLGNSIAGGFEFSRRVPGRAWILKECRPSGFKPGTDFDGMSQEVSIARLSIAMEEFEEINVGV